MLTKDDVIGLLGLEPHNVEGGHYRETYRAQHLLPASALPPRYGTGRCLGTAIYVLLDRDSPSTLHRTRSDELFHFYLGAPVTMLLLYPDGSAETPVLGTDLAAGQVPQVVVPALTWQGALLDGAGEDDFALLGTTMAPGFDPTDLETANHERLLELYPDHKGLIHKLARRSLFAVQPPRTT